MFLFLVLFSLVSVPVSAFHLGSPHVEAPTVELPYDVSNDADFDGIKDANDNCPNKANADQKDTDGDGIGNACDFIFIQYNPTKPAPSIWDVTDNPFEIDLKSIDDSASAPTAIAYDDFDSDGVANGDDNCLLIANTDQKDSDGDGYGDPCDGNDTDGPLGDSDSDTVQNQNDNCVNISNTDQADADADGIGDACDVPEITTPTGPEPLPTDTDSDGIADDKDNCKLTANADQKDADGDGLGDACDSLSTPTLSLTDEEKKLQEYQDQFTGYEDDFDEYEDDYKKADKDNDDKDLATAEKKLKNLKEDLNDFEDDVDQFEDDVKDSTTLSAQLKDMLREDIDDLQKDIGGLQEDIEDLLGGNAGTSGIQSYLPPTTTPPAAGSEKSVDVKTLNTLPPGAALAQEPVVETNWQSVRLIAWSIAGIVILLAVIIFLIALLMRR